MTTYTNLLERIDRAAAGQLKPVAPRHPLSAFPRDVLHGLEVAFGRFRCAFLVLAGSVEFWVGVGRSDVGLVVLGCVTLVAAWLVEDMTARTMPVRRMSQDERIADLRARFVSEPYASVVQFEYDLEHILGPDMVWERPFR